MIFNHLGKYERIAGWSKGFFALGVFLMIGPTLIIYGAEQGSTNYEESEAIKLFSYSFFSGLIIIFYASLFWHYTETTESQLFGPNIHYYNPPPAFLIGISIFITTIFCVYLLKYLILSFSSKEVNFIQILFLVSIISLIFGNLIILSFSLILGISLGYSFVNLIPSTLSKRPQLKLKQRIKDSFPSIPTITSKRPQLKQRIKDSFSGSNDGFLLTGVTSSGKTAFLAMFYKYLPRKEYSVDLKEGNKGVLDALEEFRNGRHIQQTPYQEEYPDIKMNITKDSIVGKKEYKTVTKDFSGEHMKDISEKEDSGDVGFPEELLGYEGYVFMIDANDEENREENAYFYNQWLHRLKEEQGKCRVAIVLSKYDKISTNMTADEFLENNYSIIYQTLRLHFSKNYKVFFSGMCTSLSENEELFTLKDYDEEDLLEGGQVNDEIVEAFEEKGYPLSGEEGLVKSGEDEWGIYAQDELKYRIEKSGNRLKVFGDFPVKKRLGDGDEVEPPAFRTRPEDDYDPVEIVESVLDT